MATIYNDDITHIKSVTFRGAVDMSAATITQPSGTIGGGTSGVAPVQVYTVAFALEAINDGLFQFSGLPANVLLLGAHIVMTTALEFSAGTTTGVSGKIGNASADDGFGLSTTLAGVAGIRRLPPGNLTGGVAIGGSDGPKITFSATGGTPLLAEVSAGAGNLILHFIEV